MADCQLTQCRICLGNCKVNVSISQQLSDGSLADYIRMVTNVNIVVNDGFPQFICCECNKDLNRCIEFREKTVRSDRILRGADITDLMKIEDNEQHQILPEQDIFATPVDFEEPATTKVEAQIDCEDDDFEDFEDNKRTTLASPTKPTTRVKVIKGKSTKKKSIKYKAAVTKCCMCTSKFKRQDHLAKHVAEVHPNGAVDENKTYTMKHKHKCSLCHRRFWQKQFLIAHYEDPNYVEPKRYECEGKRLRGGSREDPTQRQRYICTYCGQDYSSKELLAMHEARKHLVERPYACNECDRTFGHPKLLRRHKQDMHTHEILT